MNFFYILLLLLSPCPSALDELSVLHLLYLLRFEFFLYNIVVCFTEF